MYYDKPEGKPDDKVAWGSDIAAQLLHRFGYPYISLNPGASYRGLHDSIVNHLGNVGPSMVLCQHEDHSVAIAHGYAKATGEPMACVLHSNVGLMHGMMSLYNAYCDRVPVFLMAGNSLDATMRRPGVEWAHSVQDAAAMVRDFITGFFVVADGTGRPYKAYVRSPSFVHLSTASKLIHNHLIADVVPIFGMINMIGGECDR